MCLLDMDLENGCERDVFILLVSLAKEQFSVQLNIKFKKTETSCPCFWMDLSNNIKNAVSTAIQYLLQETKSHTRVTLSFFIFTFACPTLGLLFVFRILDLSYMIHSVIHMHTVDIHFCPFSFFLCHLQINYRV